MTTRVHILAKEIGVTSKAILEKCRAEGLDVKNHMATLSAGLEATIREWFSEGETTTAVETAEQVDLTKVRRRPRRKKVEQTPEAETVETIEAEAETEGEGQAEPGEMVEVELAEQESADQAETAVEVATEVVEPGEATEPQAAPMAAEGVAAPAEPSAPPAEVVVTEEAPADAEAPETVAEEAPDEGPAEQPLAPAAETAEPAQAQPAEPAPAKPGKPKVVVAPVAGPQNVPAPARMRGPTVIRVERPEPVGRPRPRGPAGGGPGGAAGGSGGSAGGTGTLPPRSPRRRGGAVGPVTEGEGGEAAGKGGKKRRTRSPRRSGHTETTERIREWRDQDLIERQERLAQATGRLKTRRSEDRHGGQVVSSKPSEVRVQAPISVKDLSSLLGIKSSDIIRKLMGAGVMAGVNHMLDEDVITMLAAEMDLELMIEAPRSADEQLQEEFAVRERKNLQPRPPVVTFLGHVDHGKTSLLDRIREADVVSGEAGGITQHIGAYRYEKEGVQVVFLDTPGHEAFTQMRSRGANMTDVVVLVVAADDGVMPQTVEAINHAKAAEVPIVVALNKIDRPDADENRVLGQLAEHGLSPREWGGDTEVIRTSALTGRGVPELLELLNLEAELLELRSDPTMAATGTVIEAQMDLGRGVLARALVQDGTLSVGDIVVCGPGFGRVKSLLSDKGANLRKAGPATPVEISGLSEIPEPGDKFYVVDDLQRAKEAAEVRQQRIREQELARRQTVTLENLFSRISAGETKELPLIIKADVQGSVDVLIDQVTRLSTEEVKVNILHAAVGGITEGDVLLAAASDAIIIGFHVVPEESARALASERGVQVRLYKIIYEITDAIRKALEGMLSPEIQEKVLGHAEVRDTFKVSRIGTIAGCMVLDGTLIRNAKYRLIRDNVVVQDNLSLDSLKRFKDDVREVRAGMECGLKLGNYDDVKVGDRLEAWTTQEVARTLG